MSGSTRTVDIIIANDKNALAAADRDTVEAFVRRTMREEITEKGSVDKVRFTNDHPDSPFEFEGPW